HTSSDRDWSSDVCSSDLSMIDSFIRILRLGDPRYEEKVYRSRWLVMERTLMRFACRETTLLPGHTALLFRNPQGTLQASARPATNAACQSLTRLRSSGHLARRQSLARISAARLGKFAQKIQHGVSRKRRFKPRQPDSFESAPLEQAIL